MIKELYFVFLFKNTRSSPLSIYIVQNYFVLKIYKAKSLLVPSQTIRFQLSQPKRLTTMHRQLGTGQYLEGNGIFLYIFAQKFRFPPQTLFLVHVINFLPPI